MDGRPAVLPEHGRAEAADKPRSLDIPYNHRPSSPSPKPTAALHAQAWKGGLQYFLSTDPPEQLMSAVADTLSRAADGALTVRSNSGTRPQPHGPSLAFYPSVINMSPGRHSAAFSY